MPAIIQKNLIVREPVVVVMGHIDHGKSTLLDYIRKTNVVAGEAGGITQHVGAYQAEHTTAEGKTHVMTFLDTPGHAAFCNIRERGAHAADIAILIVSAEDGVKPQTIEVLKNIQTEKMPYIVAITKIDKPNANIEKTKQSLSENEIYVEGWGGNIPCVAISAVTGEGVNELLDLVLLAAELEDLKTDPSLPGTGTIIESALDTRKGVSATLLIKDGSLKIGQFVVADGSYVPVRFIEDFTGKKIEEATAPMPVRIIGWSATPSCGADWKTVKNKKEAESLAEEFIQDVRAKKNRAVPEVKPKTKEEETEEPTIVSVPLIIKADVIGSLEGVKFELSKIKHDRVQLKIASEGIGDINENDVKLAQSDPNLILLGFNVVPDKKAEAMIERAPSPMNVRVYKIIYELSNYVKEVLASKIPKEYEEVVSGRAKILAIFSKEKDRQIVGGKVETGIICSGNDVRIMRRDAEIGRGKIRELQEKKLRTDEVAEGHEFGTMIEAKIEIAPGDRVECVKTVEKENH